MDLKGKICLVTGATDGIGKVTVQRLSEAGATVIGVGRNPEKIKATVDEKRQAHWNS
jgi:retinol dehydrogenase 12